MSNKSSLMQGVKDVFAFDYIGSRTLPKSSARKYTGSVSELSTELTRQSFALTGDCIHQEMQRHNRKSRK